jgi:hypothetical protein
MKPNYIFTIISVFICSCLSAQNKTGLIDLQWKLTPGDTLRYKTVMEANTTPQDTTDILAKFVKIVSSIDSPTAYTTDLVLNSKNHNLINITLYKGNIYKGSTSIFSDKLVARGCITTKGTIAANYYQTDKTNSIAMLFELPGRPVKVGETWPVHVKLIEMEQKFVADATADINKAYVEAVAQVNGNDIATIRYEIASYVSGNNISSLEDMMGVQGNNTMFLSISHAGRARFNITTGRLESYEGITTTESDGSFMDEKSQTVFRLTK